MPTLLYIVTPGRDESEMIWPWEQPKTLRAHIDVHAATCSRCTTVGADVWETSVRRVTFRPVCEPGLTLARVLSAHVAAVRAGEPEAQPTPVKRRALRRP